MLITHEMHVIQKICNRVAVMEAGKVVEAGEVLQVFRNPQAPITKRFVSQLPGTEDTNATFATIRAHYPTGQLIKLVFVGERTEEPVISQLVKQYDVSVSVVHGNISQTKSGPYGTLVVHIDGDAKNIEQSLAFLRNVDVQTEVMS